MKGFLEDGDRGICRVDSIKYDGAQPSALMHLAQSGAWNTHAENSEIET